MVQVISIILDKISVYLDLMAMEILDQLIIETIVVAIRIGKDRTEEATKEEEVVLGVFRMVSGLSFIPEGSLFKDRQL